MPKLLTTVVHVADSQFEFPIQSKTIAKEIFDKVCQTLGLREKWHFGLLFTDQEGLPGWIDLNKKVSSQGVKKETPIKMRFLAKYYPEDVAEELIMSNTKELFYRQVRDSILTDGFFCPPEIAVLLASYTLQIKYGDYNRGVHSPGFFANETLLSARIVKQHSLSKADWDEKIITWYSEHHGMFKEDATTEFLKIAQDLDMYGVNYFEISNKKGTKLWIGIDALGINIYEKDDKLTPKIGFPWSDIRNVSYSGKKFVIKPVDKNAPDFVFYSTKEKLNKRILDLSLGNNSLYLNRRRPDTIEVQHMKALALEEKNIRVDNKAQLDKEKEQREMAERQKIQLEKEIKDYQLQVEQKEEALRKSHDFAAEISKKVEELDTYRRELEAARTRADEARIEAENAVYVEKAEREQKEQEAARNHALLELKQEEAHEKAEEIEKLRRDLELIRSQVLQKQVREEEEHEHQQLLYERERRESLLYKQEVVDVDKFSYMTENYPPGHNEVRATDRNELETLITSSNSNSNGNNNVHLLPFDQQQREADYSIVSPDTETKNDSPNYDYVRHSRTTSVNVGGEAVSVSDTRERERFEQNIRTEQESFENRSDDDRLSSNDTLDHDSQDLLKDYDLLIKEEKEKISQVEKDDKLNQQLKNLRQELSAIKVDKELSRADLIYRKNVSEGRDKYKTLKQIRQGNTKIRVEIFESL